MLMFYIFIIYSITVVPFSPFALLYPANPSSPQSIPSPFSMSHSNMCFDQSLTPLSTTIPLFLTPPHPSPSYQSVPCFHVSGSIFLSSLFCSLDSSYHWGHRVFVFYRLAYFTLALIVSSSIHAVTQGRISFFLLCSIPLCRCTTVFWFTHLLMGT